MRVFRGDINFTGLSSRAERYSSIMKIGKIIAVFTFGFFIGSLGAYALTEKKWDTLKTRMERLEGEIFRVKGIIEPFEQVKKITARVTGYSHDSKSINVPEWKDGRTATGTIAYKGTVAADWDVFKPGTKLFIPGYGIGTIEDRGGRVKGHHLDVFFNSREKALEWGIKQMEVVVADNNS